MEYKIQLQINDIMVPLNEFVQDVIGNVVLGITRSLNDVPDAPDRIELIMEK